MQRRVERFRGDCGDACYGHDRSVFAYSDHSSGYCFGERCGGSLGGAGSCRFARVALTVGRGFRRQPRCAALYWQRSVLAAVVFAPVLAVAAFGVGLWRQRGFRSSFGLARSSSLAAVAPAAWRPRFRGRRLGRAALLSRVFVVRRRWLSSRPSCRAFSSIGAGELLPFLKRAVRLDFQHGAAFRIGAAAQERAEAALARAASRPPCGQTCSVALGSVAGSTGVFLVLAAEPGRRGNSAPRRACRPRSASGFSCISDSRCSP